MSAEADVVGVLERFCAGFANRDADAVMRVIAPDAAVTVVTSEQPLLRGPEELRAFLDGYVDGPTTYSWEWHRHDIVLRDVVAWVLAEGVETAAGEHGEDRHPYRMTMILELRDERWMLMHVHGSSPH